MALPLLAGQMIGAAASAIPTVVSGVTKLQTANEQKQRAQELTEEAKRVRKRGLQKEMLQAQEERELLAQSGLPTYEAAKQGLEAATANTMRSVREASPFGAAALNAIAALSGTEMGKRMELEGAQGQFKLGNRQAAIQGLQGLGQQQELLEQEKLEEQRRLRAASEALLQASTANRQGAIETIGGGLSPFGKFIGMAASGGMDDATYSTMGATTGSAGGSMTKIIQSLRAKGMTDNEILELISTK